MKLAGAVLAASLLVGGIGAAHAADLIISEPAAPMYDDVASSDWAGPYLGASIGYGAGTVEFTGTAPDGEYDIDGWLAGLQAGVLGQSGNFVYGVEGTINWADITGVDEANAGEGLLLAGGVEPAPGPPRDRVEAVGPCLGR